MRQLARQSVKHICAVCERTLLTGERATRFSPDGEDFVDVCPLCIELAIDYGWIKEGSPPQSFTIASNDEGIATKPRQPDHCQTSRTIY